METQIHAATHKTRATAFKPDLRSSCRADCSIWTRIITPKRLSEVASTQEVFRPVFWLCCCCVSFARQWDSAGEHTTSYSLRLAAAGLKPPTHLLASECQTPTSTLNPQPQLPRLPRNNTPTPYSRGSPPFVTNCLEWLRSVPAAAAQTYPEEFWGYPPRRGADQPQYRAVNDCYCHVIPLFKKAARCPSQILHRTPTCLLHIKRILIAEHRHAT